MSTVKHRGSITSTRISNGGISYVRKQPGINFPSDSMSEVEIAGMSSEVKVYKKNKTPDCNRTLKENYVQPLYTI